MIKGVKDPSGAMWKVNIEMFISLVKACSRVEEMVFYCFTVIDHLIVTPISSTKKRKGIILIRAIILIRWMQEDKYLKKQMKTFHE